MNHVKKLGMLLAGLGLLCLCGCRSLAVWEKTEAVVSADNLEAMQTACRFLKEAGHYYLATVDGDQPRVRPFGTIHIFENRLYIQTGRRKNVARQMIANGKVEICTMKGDEWIRISGIVAEDTRREAKASMLDAYESLKGMYSADDDNTMVLYFKPGTVTATISSFSHEPIVMTF